MPLLTVYYQTEAERVAYELAIAFVDELQRLGLDSPADRVLDACEGLGLERGRDLSRDSLASAVHAHIDRVEQKGSTRPVDSDGYGPDRPKTHLSLLPCLPGR